MGIVINDLDLNDELSSFTIGKTLFSNCGCEAYTVQQDWAI